MAKNKDLILDDYIEDDYDYEIDYDYGKDFSDFVEDGKTGIGYTQCDYDELVGTLRKIQENPSLLTNMKKDCLKKAKRPIFLLGGGVNIAHANEEMMKLVEKTGIPVITTIMGKGAVPTNHPLYIGNLGIHGSYAANTAISECDLLYSIGVRFNDRITGKVSEFAKNAIIIHVDIDPASISRNIEVDIPIVADAKNAIDALLEKEYDLDLGEWITKINGWKKQKPLEIRQQSESGVTPLAIIKKVNEIFDNAVITTDVGQNQLWTTQFLELTNKKKLLTSGGLGTMGYGLGACIGAKMGCPDKICINIAGDGCFRMNMNELATASRYNIPIIQVVINNHVLGMVRQWQSLFYDHRYSQTVLEDKVDFAKVAEGLGCEAITVTSKEEVAPAIEKAIACGKPVLLNCIIDKDDCVFPMVPAGAAISDAFDAEDDSDKPDNKSYHNR